MIIGSGKADQLLQGIITNRDLALIYRELESLKWMLRGVIRCRLTGLFLYVFMLVL